MAKAQSPADDLETDAALAAQFRRQIRFWTITAVVIAVLLYVFSDILLPFVAGMVLAYFLDPVADRLQRIGLSRVMATVLILFAFIVVLTLALVIVIPILVTQLSDFIGQPAAISEPAAGADHQHRSAMAGKDVWRQRGGASRRAELAADRRLRLHDDDLRVDLGVGRWRCSTSPACSW